MTENVKDFIEFHNAHVIDTNLIADLQIVSEFAAHKNISMNELSIEKHRLPFINWQTSFLT